MRSQCETLANGFLCIQFMFVWISVRMHYKTENKWDNPYLLCTTFGSESIRNRYVCNFRFACNALLMLNLFILISWIFAHTFPQRNTHWDHFIYSFGSFSVSMDAVVVSFACVTHLVSGFCFSCVCGLWLPILTCDRKWSEKSPFTTRHRPQCNMWRGEKEKKEEEKKSKPKWSQTVDVIIHFAEHTLRPLQQFSHFDTINVRSTADRYVPYSGGTGCDNRKKNR